MSDHRSFKVDRSQRRIGPIWLSRGISPRNALTLFIASGLAVGFINLLNLIQPLLLQEQLGMTSGEGDFTANVYIAIEIMSLLVVIPIANLSDIIGRRPIFTTGFLVLCLGLVIIPTATSGTELMLYRIITTIGVASCTTMVASLAADYPQNASRGKFIGTSGIFSGLGVVVVGSGLTQLPKLFVSMGYSVAEGTTYTLWIGGTLALIAAGITFAGIKKGRVESAGEKLPYLENMRIGFREISRNPRLVLGCVATGLSRGDLTVLGTFFSLWVQKAGTIQGIESVAASATAGRLFGVMQLSMLLCLPVIAIVVDRLDRVTALSISISLTALGYFALGFSPDPFSSNLIYLVVVLAGIGEAVILVSVPALVGQEAPGRFRGSIIGVAAGFGALGIILTTKASGYLFDNWSFQAPFIFMALLNCSVLVWAILVRLRTGKTRDELQAPQSEPAN